MRQASKNVKGIKKDTVNIIARRRERMSLHPLFYRISQIHEVFTGTS
jgi:hypothetical protein